MISILTRRVKNIVIAQLCHCSTKTKIPVSRPPGYLAPTSFALYVKDFAEKNPSKTPADTVVAAAKSWKEIDDELRKSYQEKSKQIDQERKSAYESLSDEDKLKLHNEYENSVEEKKKRKKRKETRELNERTGRPKLPPTAFAIFLKEFYNIRSASNSGDSTTAIMVAAANAWKELSEEEKEKYRAKAAADKRDYDEAIKVWQAAQNELEEKVSKKKVKEPKDEKPKKEKSKNERSSKSPAMGKRNLR